MIHGMAYITGGGMEGNLLRVIPEGLCAEIDLTKLRIPEIFQYIREKGNICAANVIEQKYVSHRKSEFFAK
jgi:phosphoribosylformylglycinamidine cyclo-ligase